MSEHDILPRSSETRAHFISIAAFLRPLVTASIWRALGLTMPETTCIEVALMSYHTKQLDAAIKARSLVSVQTVVLFDNTTLVLLQQTDRVNSKLCMRPV